jgi:toxin ParE1/3/4
MIALYRYLSQRFSDEAAVQFIRRIEAACLSLASAPLRGHVVSQVDSTLRVMGFERRASILFRVGDDDVDILRVLYGGQAIPSVL